MMRPLFATIGLMTTDPQDELLIQVDENNNITGSISRSNAHTKRGVYYRTIFVLVKNSKDEIMIQKRSATKDLYPNCWDLSVGGHVGYGQTYEQAAAREVGEELGMSVSESDLISKGDVLVKLPNSGEWFRVFEYNLKPTETPAANQDEINDIKWMSIEDIKKTMADKSVQWYVRPERVVAALYS